MSKHLKKKIVKCSLGVSKTTLQHFFFHAIYGMQLSYSLKFVSVVGGGQNRSRKVIRQIPSYTDEHLRA
jgi:hypothetical protein